VLSLHKLLKDKIDSLPDLPGVYIMLDHEGRIIYVGKAKSLKSRVRQYFRPSSQIGKVASMVTNINDFDYILTDTEVEALILESNLIKEHRPKYNIVLKDDKSYPYIEVTTGEDFPRIRLSRRIKKDSNNRYFGPYTSARGVRETIEVITKIFPIRTCNRNVKEGKKERPCLYYHIGRCSGPCMGNIKKEEYRETIKEVCRFLEGRQDDVIKELMAKMEKASQRLEFEKAAAFRDKINAVKKILESQKIVSTEMEDQDVIAYAQTENETALQMFFVRNGKLISAQSFILNASEETKLSHITTSFVKQYYSMSTYIPKSILIQDEIEDKETIERWLSQLKGSRVYIRVPIRGEKRKLVDMAKRNAIEALSIHEQRSKREWERTEGAVADLKEYLGLDTLPKRIECFDISNIQGSHSVASMVVFYNGRPVKSDYRRFRIKSVSGPDDFASMREVIFRRFKRGLMEKEELIKEKMPKASAKFQKFPDLVIVDGGKGQLSAAIGVMKELDIDYLPVVGLAEENDDIYRIGDKDPVILPKNSHALHLVQRIRNEAHRFAISYHRSLREKGSLHSVLNDIPGIGPKRVRELLKEFGSVAAIKDASLEELAKVKGMNTSVAKAVLDYLKN